MSKRSEIIAEFTKDCPNENCSVQELFSTSTAMSWAVVYDKQGNLTSRDPNITTTDYFCHICGGAWKTRTQYGKTKVETVEKPGGE